AVRDADRVFSPGHPHELREVMTRAGTDLGRGDLVVSVSKGVEPERLGPLSCVLGEVLPQGTPVAVLSGPSFAQEVYMHQPTAVVAAGRGHAVARRVQQAVSTDYLPGYSATDVIGVELAGALCTVFAVVARSLEGWGLG